MRSLVCLTCLSLFACTDRPLDDTSATGSSTGTASTAPSTSSDPTPGTGVDPTGGATDVPTPTTGPDTTAATPTTGPDSTATTTSTTTGLETTDPSTTTTTNDGTTLDPSGTTSLPPSGKPAGIVGCTLKAPPGTAITGTTRLGPFTGDRAYFGAVGFGDDLLSPHIVVLSPEADPATELGNGTGTTGPFISTAPLTDTFDQWPGEWQSYFEVITMSMFGSGSVTVVITGFAGNWDAADPADPPRVVGSFAGDLTGPFDAVYCDKADVLIIPE